MLSKNIWLFGMLLYLLPVSLPAQDDHEKILSEHFGVDFSKIFRFEGYLDKSLPTSFILGTKGNRIMGKINYGGGSSPVFLEGTLSEDGAFKLYEFNNRSLVTATISGTLGGSEFWEWSSANNKLTLPIIVGSNAEDATRILCYKSSKHSADQLFVNPHRAQLARLRDKDYELRWVDFQCQQEDCYLKSLNKDLRNPIEFKWKGKSSEDLLIYPEDYYELESSVHYKNICGHRFDMMYSYHYPVLDDQEFNKRLLAVIQNHINTSLKGVGKSAVNVVDEKTASRLEVRIYGDFFLTFLNRDFISGFLSFYGSRNTGIETFSFIFDIRRSKFFALEDLFKKGYDYPFFIRSFLADHADPVHLGDHKLIREAMKKDAFDHYVLAPAGLLLFTEFNSLYGRRQLLIPYEEMSAFIDSKSLLNYIRKAR